MSEIRKRITLANMVELLSRSAGQFRQEVIKFAIPHIQLGDDQLFDSEEVVAFLSSQSTQPEERDELRTNLSEKSENKNTAKKKRQKANEFNESKNKSDFLMSKKKATEFLRGFKNDPPKKTPIKKDQTLSSRLSCSLFQRKTSRSFSRRARILTSTPLNLSSNLQTRQL